MTHSPNYNNMGKYNYKSSIDVSQLVTRNYYYYN